MDWYQIENSTFTMQLTSAGAEMKRLFCKPWHRELLWVPKDEKTQNIWNRTAPILFPIVGKLKNDSYSFEGKNYKLTQHGFARDMEFECLSCGTQEIEFALKSSQKTLESYPFLFELLVKYALVDKRINIAYTVKNADQKEMFFSLGAHPAFETFKIEDFEIHFEKKEKGFFRLNNSLVDWHTLYPLDEETLVPTKDLFAQDALIFKDLKSRYIDLIDQKRHETLRVNFDNSPFLGLWGKGSVPFVCIEPWFGVSDEEAHDQKLVSKRGILKLAPGQNFNYAFSIEISP